MILILSSYLYVLYNYINLISAKPNALNRIDLPHFGENGTRRTMNATRRILMGREVGDTRPYMVYLRPVEHAELSDPNWVCGGAIIHERYILTSAACIEDVQHFYIVSGTRTWIPNNDQENECVNNGAKRAIWKCVPKNYVYDGDQYDNIRWMVGDIAVVKIEDEFNFKRRVRGCDFTPQKIAYNNVSEEHEKRGTHASIAGWGATGSFSELFLRTASNSPELLETDVILLSRKSCEKRWPPRYHYIIQENMVCGKDSDHESMNNKCQDGTLKCKAMEYSDEEEEEEDNKKTTLPLRIFEDDNDDDDDDGRRNSDATGGFCENDHGGPLVVGYGQTAMVIGVISAAQTTGANHMCTGPFLFTSVFKFRNLISCAIDKDVPQSEITPVCPRLLRTQTSETVFVWSSKTKLRSKLRSKNVTPRPVSRNDSSSTTSTTVTTTTTTTTTTTRPVPVTVTETSSVNTLFRKIR